MTRYEYATLVSEAGAADLIDQLDAAGEEGFELIAVCPCTSAAPAALLFTFKRPLPQEPDPTTHEATDYGNG